MRPKWKCDECECLNEEKIVFRYDSASPRREVVENGRTLTLVTGKCTRKECHHASTSHHCVWETKKK